MRAAYTSTMRAAVRLSLVACAIAALPLRAVAQDAVSSAWKRAHCMAGVTYGAPLKFAVSYGGGVLHESDARDVCAMGLAKLGVGGAQAGVGIGSTIGPLGGGALITANVLRTFASPLHALPRRTYVGATLHLWPLLGLGGSIGLYTRVGADPAGVTSSRRLVAWSAGFGF